MRARLRARQGAESYTSFSRACIYELVLSFAFCGAFVLEFGALILFLATLGMLYARTLKGLSLQGAEPTQMLASRLSRGL